MSDTELKNTNRHQAGFTIAEILVATAIFSIVLLVALAGFLQIGHIFYKGVSLAQTQEVANHIFQDINGNFQTAANVSPPQSNNGYQYFCVGNTRYTYRLGNEVNLGGSPDHSPSGSFGILKDILPGSSACAAPCSDTGVVICNPPNVELNNPTELLGEKMRVSNFSIANPNASALNLYSVSIVIAYGDDDVLDQSTPTAPFCKGNVGDEFCAVSQINTAVYKGWRQ